MHRPYGQPVATINKRKFNQSINHSWTTQGVESRLQETNVTLRLTGGLCGSVVCSCRTRNVEDPGLSFTGKHMVFCRYLQHSVWKRTVGFEITTLPVTWNWDFYKYLVLQRGNSVMSCLYAISINRQHTLNNEYSFKTLSHNIDF